MQPTDRAAFATLMHGVYDFYGKDLSDFAISIWWEAMRPYDLAAVQQTMSRHLMNPDNGQWLPKPADVVKLMGGGTQDSALLAWAKVDRAVRSAGPYQSVVFDDPIIHAVVSDMGGWTELCSHDENEWPFRAKEFEHRYRGARLRANLGGYPGHLPGLAEMSNKDQSRPVAPPLMIGDPARCAQVAKGGSDEPRLSMMPMRALTDRVMETLQP